MKIIRGGRLINSKIISQIIIKFKLKWSIWNSVGSGYLPWPFKMRMHSGTEKNGGSLSIIFSMRMQFLKSIKLILDKEWLITNSNWKLFKKTFVACVWHFNGCSRMGRIGAWCFSSRCPSRARNQAAAYSRACRKRSIIRIQTTKYS